MRIENQIKVSVVVPIYNAERYLKQCLDSIVSQTLQEIEIILVDDGSTDKSAEICKTYLNDARVSYHRKENEGLAAARADGISYSHGEYIGFVDSDDWCEPDMYEKMYNAGKSNCSDVVFCNCYENVSKKNPKFYRSGAYNREQIEKEIFPKLLISVDKDKKRVVARWSNWLRIYRRANLEKNNVQFDRRFRRCQDLPFTFEATIWAENYYYLGDDYLYHNRQDPGSLSRGYTKQMWKLLMPLIERIQTVIEQYPRYDFSAYADTTTFFLASDCVVNEVREHDLPFSQKVDHIKEIVSSGICKDASSRLDAEDFNFVYAPILRCMQSGKVIHYLLWDKWRKSKLRNEMAYPFITWLFKMKWFSNLYHIKK